MAEVQKRFAEYAMAGDVFATESTETSFILLINFKDNCFDSMRLASDKI